MTFYYFYYKEKYSVFYLITIILLYSIASKRGIAWPLENKQDSSSIFIGGKVSWIYNWSRQKYNNAVLEFVPMLWNTNKGHDGSQFFNQAKRTTAALGFNEPERSEQANMTEEIYRNIYLLKSDKTKFVLFRIYIYEKKLHISNVLHNLFLVNEQNQTLSFLLNYSYASKIL